jgi:hypothetical protein
VSSHSLSFFEQFVFKKMLGEEHVPFIQFYDTVSIGNISASNSTITEE